MKKLKYLLLACIVLVSVVQVEAQGQYQLHGSVTGIMDGNVYLLRRQVEDFTKTDTLGQSQVKNGKFTISGSIESPCIVHLKFDEVPRWLDFILEPASITVTAKKTGKGFSDISVSGGKAYHKQVFDAFKVLDTDREYQKLLGAKNDCVQKYKNLKKQQASKTDLEAAKLEYKKARKNAANCFASRKYNMISASKDPVYKLLMAHKHAGAYDKMDEIVNVNAPLLGDEHYLIRFLKSRTAQIRQMEADEKSMATRTQYMDITIPDIHGKKVKLSDVLKRNKYVLLEFWASWCGPCRHEIPNLKKAYQLYHDKGFEIVSVSVDDNKEKWLKASEKENLQWINTCDLQAFDSKIVKKYAVHGVPSAFLIDAKGKIVAHKPRGQKLQDLLKKLLD